MASKCRQPLKSSRGQAFFRVTAENVGGNGVLSRRSRRIVPAGFMPRQGDALFDSLTVADNVGYRPYEETDMPTDQVRRQVEEVLGFRRSSDERHTARRRIGFHALAEDPGAVT